MPDYKQDKYLNKYIAIALSTLFLLWFPLWSGTIRGRVTAKTKKNISRR
ncbi:MAG: hypothetical protein GY940_18160 [bacterium]|nr:hypothetical protein [bacterium]